MADKITLPEVQSGYDVDRINSNFNTLVAELNSRVLYRTPPANTDNAVQADIDMNGHQIYNLRAPVGLNEAARLIDVINGGTGGGVTPGGPVAATDVSINTISGLTATNVQTALQQINAKATGGGTGGGVNSIVPGTNISVDASSAANPIVSFTGNLAQSRIDGLVTSLANKANNDNPSFTGAPTAPTPITSENSTRIANTAWVRSVLGEKANLISPSFSGVPLAPTAPVGTNSTQIATTAFVMANGGSGGSFNAGYTGSTPRTFNTKMADFISVKDFGAKGDGVTDDYAAIQNAINQCPNLYFPSGTYVISQMLDVPSGGARSLWGSNPENTIIRLTSQTAPGIRLNAWYSDIRNIKFTSQSGYKTAGAYVELIGASCGVRTCIFEYGYQGVYMFGPSNRVLDCVFAGNAQIHIFVSGGDTSPVIHECIIMDAQTSGIQVDHNAALILSNTSILICNNCLNINPGSGYSVFSVKVTDCFFDSSQRGIAIVTKDGTAVYRCTFTNCWTGGHSAQGVLIDSTAGGIIDGMDFVTNESHISNDGIAILGSNTRNIKLTNCRSGGNANSGVFIGPGVQSVRIHGGHIGEGGGLNGNQYGINISGGVVRYHISDVTLLGNTVGPLVGHTFNTVDHVVKHNTGFISEKTGTVEMLPGQTVLTVAHGLTQIPASVIVSPNGDTASRWWTQFSEFTPTTFTIHMQTALPYNTVFSYLATI